MMLDAQNEHINISFVKSEPTCPSTLLLAKNSKYRHFSVTAAHSRLLFRNSRNIPPFLNW